MSETVSVLLCTYNGANHLAAMWQSLLDQQRAPDEVVVCDDHSSDGSYELVRAFQRRAQHRLRRDYLGVLLRTNLGYGITMAMRAEQAKACLPVPAGWSFDGWLALALSATVPTILVRRPLLLYRQHPNQQMPNRLLPKAVPWWRRVTAPEVNRYGPQMARYRSFLAWVADRDLSRPATTARIEALIHHYHRRGFPPHRRLARLAYLLPELVSGRYHRFSNGFRGFAKDLLLM